MDRNEIRDENTNEVVCIIRARTAEDNIIVTAKYPREANWNAG